MSLNALTHRVQFSAVNSKQSDDSTTQSESFGKTYSAVPSDATILLHDRYTIATGADLELDLSGSLEDQLGQSAVFTKVYGFVVANLSTTSGEVIRVGNS